jgi:hypothetical protein
MVWWKKALFAIFAFVAWISGLIVVGGWGYPSQYFWVSFSTIAIVVAAAPFWKRRCSIWYWPSVALMTVINLAVLYVERDYVAQSDLPAKGIVQWLVIVDCMACWLLMVGFAYLADRRFPWKD